MSMKTPSKFIFLFLITIFFKTSDAHAENIRSFNCGEFAQPNQSWMYDIRFQDNSAHALFTIDGFQTQKEFVANINQTENKIGKIKYNFKSKDGKTNYGYITKTRNKYYFYFQDLKPNVLNSKKMECDVVYNTGKLLCEVQRLNASRQFIETLIPKTEKEIDLDYDYDFRADITTNTVKQSLQLLLHAPHQMSDKLGLSWAIRSPDYTKQYISEDLYEDMTFIKGVKKVFETQSYDGFLYRARCEVIQ